MTAVTQTASEALEKDIILDINGDDAIDLLDIIGVLKILAGQENIEYVRIDYPVSAMDVNGDEKLSIAEALNIMQILANLKD